jgi:hypothetical protein
VNWATFWATFSQEHLVTLLLIHGKWISWYFRICRPEGAKEGGANPNQCDEFKIKRFETELTKRKCFVRPISKEKESLQFNFKEQLLFLSKGYRDALLVFKNLFSKSRHSSAYPPAPVGVN